MPLEAQACGRPVIAYGRGGALETVVDGVTGLFFTEQTPRSLRAAVERFVGMESAFDPARIRRHAAFFSRDRFKAEMQAFIGAKLDDWKAGYPPNHLDRIPLDSTRLPLLGFSVDRKP